MNRPQLEVREQRPSRYILLGVTFLVLGAVIWGIANLQKLRDFYLYETFHPTAALTSIVSQDTMTVYAKRLFYINHPVLATKTVFAANCPNDADSSYVIGCYHEGDNGIWLLNVNDSQLAGIVPVTAAYEMLHAGYARLSDPAKTTLDNEMWNFYLSNVSSPEIHQQMAAYAKTEPGARYDELYSVLATEVSDLPASLEDHYQQYFSDRQQLVSMYDAYQASFTSREDAVNSYNSELSSLKDTINRDDSSLATLLNQINAENASLNSEEHNANYAAYNTDVNSYNLLVDRYNALVKSERADITQYNAVVASRNALVIGEQQLIQAISTSPQPESAK